MSNLIQLETRQDRLIIRFARPELRNPLSAAVLDELDAILNGLDNGINKLLFTGTDDVFASGADLREISNVSERDAKEFARRGQSLMNRIAGLEQKTVAAIGGFCFGGALDLALACDTRICAPNAKFAHPGAGLGIITGWGGTQRLPRLVGKTFALEMFFTASPIGAERALSIGLVDEVRDHPLAAALEVSGDRTI